MTTAAVKQRCLNPVTDSKQALDEATEQLLQAARGGDELAKAKAEARFWMRNSWHQAEELDRLLEGRPRQPVGARASRGALAVVWIAAGSLGALAGWLLHGVLA